MENIELKKTPYNQIHHDLGAKMAEFAGYDMPIQYTGLVEEHNNVRNNVGYFIAYKDLFSTWLTMGKDFDVSNVTDALSAFSRLIKRTSRTRAKNGHNWPCKAPTP